MDFSSLQREVTQGSGHYRQLDLTVCGRLRILSVQIYNYWEQARLYDPGSNSWASSCVLNLLDLFVYRRPPPALQCLDLQVNDYAVECGAEDLERVPYSQMDDALFRATITGRLQAVSLRSWGDSFSQQEYWEMIHPMFPRLSENGLLSRHRVR